VRAERGVLYVPVRVCAYGIVSIRTGCLPSGQQVGLAFTAQANLAAALGLRHASIRIHIQALYEMLKPRGITQVFIDVKCPHCLPAVTSVSALEAAARIRQLTWETALRTPSRQSPSSRSIKGIS
jgi:hypothetical protein